MSSSVQTTSSLSDQITRWLEDSSVQKPPLLHASDFLAWQAKQSGAATVKGRDGQRTQDFAVKQAMRGHPRLEQIDTGARTTTFRLRA